MKRLIIFAVGALLIPISSQAAYTIKDGKLIGMHELATLSVQEHYSLAKEALEKKDWVELIRQSQIVTKNFSGTVFALDSYFYLGVAYFNMHEFDLANMNFDSYLKKQTTPKLFEEAFQYKFSIAQQFEHGAKRRFLGKENMPKWMPAQQEALLIYDEVIMALPQHDLAVQSLFGKANVLFEEEEFKSSIETFQTLLRRFPRHPLARDSYIAITKVYAVQAEKEYPDPDFLDLAAINVKKFKMDFRGDPKVAEAEEFLAEMVELYAKELYKTAQFYERTKKPNASVIYYSKIVSKYPDSETAAKSQQRLDVLQPEKKEADFVIPKNPNAMVVEASSLDEAQAPLQESSEVTR